PDRDAEPVQRREQPVAAAVSGEDAAGPVAAVRGRCEANDEQTRTRIAPTGDRTAPVRLIGERAAAIRGHLLPPGHQAWAGSAHRAARGQVGEIAGRAAAQSRSSPRPTRATSAALVAPGVSVVPESSGQPEPGSITAGGAGRARAR